MRMDDKAVQEARLATMEDAANDVAQGKLRFLALQYAELTVSFAAAQDQHRPTVVMCAREHKGISLAGTCRGYRGTATA